MEIKLFKDPIKDLLEVKSVDLAKSQTKRQMTQKCKGLIISIYSLGCSYLKNVYDDSSRESKRKSLSKFLDKEVPNVTDNPSLLNDFIEAMSRSDKDFEDGLRLIFDQSITGWAQSLNDFINGNPPATSDEVKLLKDKLSELVGAIQDLSKQHGYDFKWDPRDYRLVLIKNKK